ncbi:hypothetical protein D3C77_686510 [compost metagenome]
MAVVLLAIILDRITESFGTPRPARCGGLYARLCNLLSSAKTSPTPRTNKS